MEDMVSPTIADVKRQATVDVVLDAARRVLFSAGLDVTMDDMAEAAGVGRRTLFRYFETRERLVAEALEAGIQRYGELLPTFSGDWQTWLRDVCTAAHHMQSGYGPGYWELISRTDLPPEIAAVETRRRARRHAAMTRIAGTLWHEVGGEHEPPDHVVAGVIVNLSPRFTAAVMTDAGATWRVAADLANEAISDLLARTRPQSAVVT